MPFMPFTRADVKLMFELSEPARGHAGARHVSITNVGMVDRQMGGRGREGLAEVTSFLKFDDQIDAALELLNAPANDAALERFRVEKRAGVAYPGSSSRYAEIEHRLNAPVPMRYAIGGTTRTFPCQKVKLVFDKAPGRPFDLHIVTFFGMFG